MTREFLVGIVLAVGLPVPGPPSGQTPAPAAPEARGRVVALTFDDLPATRSADLGRVRAITTALDPGEQPPVPAWVRRLTSGR